MAKKRAPARIRNRSHEKSGAALAVKGHSVTPAGVKPDSLMEQILQVVSNLLCTMTLAGISAVFANTLAKNDWSIGYFIPTLVAIAITAIADPMDWIPQRLRSARFDPLHNLTGAITSNLSPDVNNRHIGDRKWQHKKGSINSQSSSVSCTGIGTEVAEDKHPTTAKLYSSASRLLAANTTAKASSSPHGSRSSSPVRFNSIQSATSLDQAQTGGARLDTQKSSGSHSISPKSTGPKATGLKSTGTLSATPSSAVVSPKSNPAQFAKAANPPRDAMTEVSQQHKEGTGSGVAPKKKRVQRNQLLGRLHGKRRPRELPLQLLRQLLLHLPRQPLLHLSTKAIPLFLTLLF